MDYLAISRKWRPSRFEELVGQVHVVQTLKNAISHNRVVHAYLFAGARGVGKTSVARIFAKALRCPNATDGTPCDTCTECLAIAESRSIDVVEIDGASNNGVEAIRSIRENVAYGASSGKYKIYIIDEVHMLSISAFNALLKTLEEPPAHVIFIMATTESQKIPLTILSRCQRFEFRRLTNDLITARLKKILGTEEITISEDALYTIASHADGSLRDAESLLDQVLSYYGGKKELNLDEKQVTQALGLSEAATIRQFIHHIIDKDPKALIALTKDIYYAGMDLKHFAERVLEELRLFYLTALATENKIKPSANDLNISTSHLDELIKSTKKTSLLQIERMVQILNRTISQLSWSSLPRFALEMAAVRMCYLDALSKVEEALINNQAISPATETAPAPSVSKALPQNSPPPQKAAPVSVPVPGPVSPPHKSWEGLVATVMKRRPLLGALLSHANFKLEENEGKNKVILAFPKNSFYEKQALENTADIIGQLKDFFGPDTTLQLSNEMKETNKSIEASKEEEDNALKKKAMQHPEVLKVKEMLGAEIVDVKIDQP